MKRILLPLLAIALAMGGYWLFRGDGDSSNSPVSGRVNAIGTTKTTGQESASEIPDSTARSPTAPTPLRMRSTDRSEHRRTRPTAASDSIANAFENEEHDAAQAAVHTKLVRDTVEDLVELGGGTVQVAELACRTRHCKLRLSSDDTGSLGRLTAALQDDRGFLGKAESLMLSRQGDDIVFYLRFSPPK